ncbi:MAG: hypothetical protein IPO72_15950 [Saprospiraceae bacterium]|nr:hypothetical protein [Candidatus Vicinibacter affinis]
MKLFKSLNFWVVSTILLLIGYAISCTKTDQVLDTGVKPKNSSELLSIKVASPPTIDGAIDAQWENSPKLEFSTAVPEVTGDVFRGYTGNIIPSVTLRSAYDTGNVYMLVEWADPTQSLKRGPWYFDPTTRKWAQESGTFGFTSTPYRAPFYEDKIAFLWNINNSVSGWNSATCYKSCHTGLPAADGSSRHFTNYPTERIDMWHWKSVRGGANAGHQVHDQYQDNTYPNGRKSDAGVDVYQNNTQNLPVTGSSPVVTVAVPKYVIPGKTDYNWIYNEEFTSGVAKQVVAVDTIGVLTLNDGTKIDPNGDTGYQRIGTFGSGGLGTKAIPGVTLNSAYTGSAGDILCFHFYRIWLGTGN